MKELEDALEQEREAHSRVSSVCLRHCFHRYLYINCAAAAAAAASADISDADTDSRRIHALAAHVSADD